MPAIGRALSAPEARMLAGLPMRSPDTGARQPISAPQPCISERQAKIMPTTHQHAPSRTGTTISGWCRPITRIRAMTRTGQPLPKPALRSRPTGNPPPVARASRIDPGRAVPGTEEGRTSDLPQTQASHRCQTARSRMAAVQWAPPNPAPSSAPFPA